MFVYDNGKGEFFIPTYKIEAINTWIEKTNAKELADEVIWEDYSVKTDLIVLTHGYWGMIQIDGKLVTLKDFAKEYGDKIISLGYTTINIICCRSAFLLPVIYKGLIIRPIIVSPLELFIQGGSITIDSAKQEAVLIKAQPKTTNKFMRKVFMHLSYKYALLMLKVKPKIIK